MKKMLLYGIGGLSGLVLLLGVSQWIASESGEVVVLTTRDAAGEPHDTRLWVVEHAGHAWLRAGAEVQGWYQRLVASPAVAVERDGATAPYTAVPVPAERGTVNALMREKYGWADRYISLLFGRDDAVPIRLDAAPGP